MKDIEKLHCEICKKEIPRSVAISFEGMDYVHNFCSIECHEHYFVDHPEEKKEEEEEEEEKPR